MREDILAASIRVLRRDGPLHFTTPRVAQAAGISVGSLYQYFPNKESLLFALHSRAVETAWVQVQAIFDNGRWTPREKIRRIARLYFDLESADVQGMGPLLHDIDMHFEAEPEHEAMHARIHERVVRFVRDAMPKGTPRSRIDFGARLLIKVLENVGRSVAADKLEPREIKRWADATADMIAGHLACATASLGPG